MAQMLASGQRALPASSDSPGTGHLSSLGRPLSIIESVASSPDGGDSSDGDMHSEDGAPSHRNGTESEQELKTQIHELLKIGHALGPDGSSHGSPSSSQEQSAYSILIKDLPALLAEYEEKTGQSLLDEEAKYILNKYVEESPDLELVADQLQEMITQLNASARGEEKEERDVWKAELIDEGHERASGTSESDADHSSTEDEDVVGSDKQSRRGSSAHSRSYDFPRSQSESVVQSLDGQVKYRSKTTSDPSVPLTNPRRPSTTSRDGKGGERERRESGEAGEKEVLKGKARNPPSSWTKARPKPPAKIRSRRVSDISSTYSDQLEQYEADGRSPLPTSASFRGLGVGTPSSPSMDRIPRQRLSSQPELRSQITGGAIPRSLSSTSTRFFDRGDEWDQYPRDYITSSVDNSYARSPSLRAVSPGLDERSFTNFNALSPTKDPEYASRPDVGRTTSRRSSGAGRRRELEVEEGDETLMGNDDAIALRARLEAVLRALAEKERKIDSIQVEHEEYISRIQAKLEDADVNGKKRDRDLKDVRLNEFSQREHITSLESKLSNTEKMLKMARDQVQKIKNDYDEQVAETDRLRVKVVELQEELQKVRDEEQWNAESGRQWEGERERYRETIVQLNGQVERLEAETVKWQEEERENGVLKEQIERLTAEMEELRRGSSLLGSRSKGSEVDSGTFSKRLGSELAKQMGDEEGSGSGSEGGEEEEGDGSTDTLYLYKRKRVPKSQRSGKAVVMEEKSSGPECASPPTYDEAALERVVSDRLHPRLEGVQTRAVEDGKGERGAYSGVAEQLGVRCTVLEELLDRSASAEKAAPCESTDPIVSLRQRLSHCLLSASDSCTGTTLSLLAHLPLPSSFQVRLKGIRKSGEGSYVISSLIACLAFFLLGMGFQSFWSPGHTSLHLLEDWSISDSLLLPWGHVPGSERMQASQARWSHRSSLPPRVPT